MLVSVCGWGSRDETLLRASFGFARVSRRKRPTRFAFKFYNHSETAAAFMKYHFWFVNVPEMKQILAQCTQITNKRRFNSLPNLLSISDILIISLYHTCTYMQLLILHICFYILHLHFIPCSQKFSEIIFNVSCCSPVIRFVYGLFYYYKAIQSVIW